MIPPLFHPSDPATERKVLGSLLLPEIYASVIDDVDKDLFYEPQNKTIFRVIQEIAATAEPNDDLLVAKLSAHIDKPGLIVADLLQESAKTISVPHLIKHLRELKARREAINAGYVLMERAKEPDDDNVYDIISDAQKILIDIQESKSDTPILIGDAMSAAASEIKRRQELKKLDGLMSGYTKLDELTHGFLPGELILVAARPGMGKTAFVLQFLHYLAAKEGKASLFYSLEMSTQQLAQRLISNIGEIAHDRITKSWTLHREDTDRIKDIIRQNQDLPLYIQETPGLTGEKFYTKARRLMLSEKNLAVVAVDHATRMSGTKGREDNYHKFTEISRRLKDTAMQLRLPVVALVQLNRGVEQRDDKRPKLSDLRDTGAWEEDADKILFLYRDSYYNKNSDDKYGAEVIVAKNRSGSCGTVNLLFRNECVRFYERKETKNGRYEEDS